MRLDGYPNWFRRSQAAFAGWAPAFSLQMQYNYGVGLQDLINEIGSIGVVGSLVSAIMAAGTHYLPPTKMKIG